MKQLQARVAVVTGAASGIGRGLAQALGDAGMSLVVADLDEAGLSEVAAGLSAAGVKVRAVVTDVSKAAEIEALADAALAEFGAVHVVCNNAGINIPGSVVWETSAENWEWIVNVNLMGVVHGTRIFTPILMQQDEGHIVNTASLAGLMTNREGGAYGVTKHAVVALSEATALQLAQHAPHVHVSVLCPGPVNTNILDSAGKLRERVAIEHEAAGALPRAVRRAFRRWLQHDGMAPRAVADRVIEAIENDQFYVLPHAWDRAVEQRMRNILQRKHPEPPADAAPGLMQYVQEELTPKT